MTKRALLLAIGFCAGLETAAAEPLGRLFFTPERRAALERQRQLNIQEIRPLEGSTVSLDGIVTRSSGRSTVWINQRPQNESETGSGVTATVSPANPSQATVAPGEEPAASLRVGESINRATREKGSALGEGRIVVKRSANGK